jgi:hypothetical protein
MNNNKSIPAGSKLNLLRQICNFIPEFLVPKIARETSVDKKARTFTPWSHVIALLYAQLTHSIGLNDVCDALGLHSGPLSSIRGATPPSRNNLSNCNKVRSAEMAEKLFWAVFEHLGDLSPRFVSGKAGKRFARKFKRTIHLVDSTTIPLIASCMDWAKHRRRKAAAKCHVRLDLQSFLPRFAIVDTARHADAKRAREVCAGIQAGEIVIFDKAYIDFSHLADLSTRAIFWVTPTDRGTAKSGLIRGDFRLVEGGVADRPVPLNNAADHTLIFPIKLAPYQLAGPHQCGVAIHKDHVYPQVVLFHLRLEAEVLVALGGGLVGKAPSRPIIVQPSGIGLFIAQATANLLGIVGAIDFGHRYGFHRLEDGGLFSDRAAGKHA